MKKRTQGRARRRSGFTLLELLIVLAIIVVIAAMVVPNLIGRRQEANVDLTKSAISTVESSLKMYAARRGDYPEGGTDVLDMLLEPTEYKGRMEQAYLERPARDAWGKPLNYEYPNTKVQNGVKPAIWSNGPDGKDDGGDNDDINNWTIEVDE